VTSTAWDEGPSVVLESVTGVPAARFAALPPVAQAAVVARIVPERVRTLDIETAEAVVAITQRAINVLAGVRDVAIAACVRAEELRSAELEGEWVPGETHRPDAVKIVASSLAPMLARSPGAMRARVSHALTVVDDLPQTLAEALDGQLDERQVGVIAREAELLDPAGIAVFDRQLHADGQVGSLPPARLARACERAAVVADSDAVERRAVRAVEDRFVRVCPGVDPGMAFWTASLDSLESAKAWAAIDGLAHEYVRAEGNRTIDQARADAMLDLLLGSATVTTTVELVVPTCVDAPRDVTETNRREGPTASPASDSEADTRGSPTLPEPARVSPRDRHRSRQGRTPGDDRLGQAFHDGTSGRLAEGASAAGEQLGPSADAVVGTVQDAMLDLVSGPPIGTLFAIGSELFGGGHPDLDGLPEASAVKRLVMAQNQAMARERDEGARRLFESQGIRFARWRPPEFGVRDARVGWLLNRTLLGILTDPDVVLRITRADALTGVTVARDPLSYRPNSALARRIRDRDRTCRFPSCGVAARRCDLDHVVPFPDGTTIEENLICLCRTHHGFKHHAGWVVLLHSDGTCSWTAPTGRTYVTRPADLRDDAA
jgi:hypothetical protein